MSDDVPRKRRTLLLYTKQCRQCNLPFSTTSKVQVVHPECRIAYYQKVARDGYRKNSTRPRSPDVRARRNRNASQCNILDQSCACEACGCTSLTKSKKFFHLPKEEETEGKYLPHTLCFQCIMLYRYGLLEALTWKQIDVLAASTATAVSV